MVSTYVKIYHIADPKYMQFIVCQLYFYKSVKQSGKEVPQARLGGYNRNGHTGSLWGMEKFCSSTWIQVTEKFTLLQLMKLSKTLLYFI